ncbi:MAG: DMT family transporter [Bacteroidales bacterium]
MKKLLVIGSALIASFIFGISFVWSKIAFHDFGPISTITIRLIISAIFLLGFSKLFRLKLKIQKKDWKTMIIGAILSPFLTFFAEYEGLTRINATDASVIVSTLPLFTPIAAYFFLKERFKAIFFIGLIISSIGVFITLTSRDFQFNASPTGVIIESSMVIAAVLYSVVQKNLCQSYNPIIIILYQNTISVLLYLPFLYFMEWEQLISVKPSIESIRSMLLLAIFASSVAFILYTYSINKLGASKANLYFNLLPVFTAITAFFYLNEKLTTHKIIGIIIVIGGLYLSQTKISKTLVKKTKKQLSHK